MIERMEHSEKLRATLAAIGRVTEVLGFIILLIFLVPAALVAVFWVWFVLSRWFGIPSPYTP